VSEGLRSRLRERLRGEREREVRERLRERRRRRGEAERLRERERERDLDRLRRCSSRLTEACKDTERTYVVAPFRLPVVAHSRPRTACQQGTLAHA
jgi:hypothetical protein